MTLKRKNVDQFEERKTNIKSMKNIDTKAIREQLSLTQEQFSQVLNVSLRTVIRWEKNDSRPQAAAKKKIQFLAELLENGKTKDDIKALIFKAGGNELLKSALEAKVTDASTGQLSTALMGLTAGGLVGGVLGTSLGAGGILGPVAHTSALFLLYQLLAKVFEGNEKKQK